MRHCLIPISLALTLAIALVGCGMKKARRLASSCQSYCETFFIKYGECVEAMTDDTRSTAISTCFEEIEAQSAEGDVPAQIKAASVPPKKPRSPRWTAVSLGKRIRIKRSAGEPAASQGRATSAHQPGTVLRARPQERRDKHPECDLPCRGEIL